ncbi:energy transducer TonB [Rhodobacteraceae bacterium B1Z28]|uniref:Energy transducer TonB n=1 Tax=Ruegeria haliotis TaxID=2747601 RepID=A0ABX2PSN5_9RHOB|nr:energy transducer TonB [Ruegeria haliotis]NVO57175.1 energy transducer TonB [Ruegeria haliotis]
MDTGTKISAIAHVSLIGWALFGGTFRSEPLPMSVQDVSVITAEQFAAMTAQRDAPEVPTTPSTLQQPPDPEVEANAPEPTQEEQPRPEPVTPSEPEPEIEPEPVEVPPEPEVIEEPPVLTEPEPEIAALPVPPGPEAQPRAADRIAPEAIAPPPPEAQPDDVETPPVSLDEGAEIQQEQQDQTAPEEAAPEIVTEAEETDEQSPLTSPRPRVRPNRPTPPAEPVVAETPEPAPENPAQNDEAAINDALAEALGSGTEPSGPPLTSGEKDAMRLAVSRCWNVGSLSTDALSTVVVVEFSMNRDGTVVGSSISMLDSSGGSAAAANQAYQAARRAILRCGAKGFDLPADKYAQWQEIEITFNPERMRIK